MRYALGVGGLAAVVAIALIKWKLEAQTAVFGGLIVLAFMVVLVIFAVLAGLKPGALKPLALVLAWSFLVLMVAVAVLFVSCAFFNRPKSLPCLLRNECSETGEPTTVMKSPAQTELATTPIEAELDLGVKTAYEATEMKRDPPRERPTNAPIEESSVKQSSISKAAEGRPVQDEANSTPAQFRGQLDLDSFCRSQFGDTFEGLAGEVPRCIRGTDTRETSFSEVCFWQFGSERYEIQLHPAMVLCDTSIRKDPPCDNAHRYCGQDRKYCCPKR